MSDCKLDTLSSGCDAEISGYDQSAIDLSQLRTVLTKTHRLAARVQQVTEGFLSHSASTDRADYADYCRSLLTLSTSINRLLYQFDLATGIDPVDLIAGKKGLLSAKVPEKERLELYSSIQIRQFEDSVEIYLPYIPGKRQIERQFISELLFQRLLDEGPYPHWDRVHVLFTHVYPSNLSRLPKDVDNFNYKPIIDYLAAALRFSDAASTCSLEMRAEFRDDITAGAYIQITPRIWSSTLTELLY